MPFKISDFSISTLQDNKYVKPVQLCYIQNGNTRSWEAVQCHDSVSVLLYHRGKNAFLLVKQFRPPVHMNHPQHTYTYELCAGLVDKECSLEQIAREEINEECGYDVPVEKISRVNSFFTNVGITGNQQHLFFAVIDETMKTHSGGGVHNEEIILEYVPLDQAKVFIFDENLAKTPGLMFAFYWFFDRYGKCEKKSFTDAQSSPHHR